MKKHQNSRFVFTLTKRQQLDVLAKVAETTKAQLLNDLIEKEFNLLTEGTENVFV
jgi:hypothetical protein